MENTKIKQPYIFVLLHGFKGNPELLNPIEKLIKTLYENTLIIKPKIVSSIFSSTHTSDIINNLLVEVDNAWNKFKDNQPKVILVGHSMGGVFARKLYICAWARKDNPLIEKNIHADIEKDWAPHVERIVLLAGINNGWELNFHLNFKTAAIIKLFSPFAYLLDLAGRKPMIYKLRKGGTFITQLRLQSIKMQNSPSIRNKAKAFFIQLLGTVDDLVSPDDNNDLIAGGDFVYLDVSYSSHRSIIEIDEPTEATMDGKKTTIGCLRKEKITNALINSKDTLSIGQIQNRETTKIVPDEKVTDVVFVIHGIRDDGYWTRKVAQRVLLKAKEKQAEIKKLDPQAIVPMFETETSSYGYFPLLHFALPNSRREKVEWLMEQYAENQAKYPNARFSYMGHSNGTYLLAKALDKYEACEFKHVLFAGSVVNQKYDWNAKIVAKIRGD